MCDVPLVVDNIDSSTITKPFVAYFGRVVCNNIISYRWGSRMTFWMLG